MFDEFEYRRQQAMQAQLNQYMRQQAMPNPFNQSMQPKQQEIPKTKTNNKLLLLED